MIRRKIENSIETKLNTGIIDMLFFRTPFLLEFLFWNLKINYWKFSRLLVFDNDWLPKMTNNFNNNLPNFRTKNRKKVSVFYRYDPKEQRISDLLHSISLCLVISGRTASRKSVFFFFFCFFVFFFITSLFS